MGFICYNDNILNDSYPLFHFKILQIMDKILENVLWKDYLYHPQTKFGAR